MAIPTLIPQSGGIADGEPRVQSHQTSPNYEGRRYCRVVLSANGRVKPDLVIVDDKPEAHPEGAYYLESREGKKRVRLSVGKNPQDAAARRLAKEAELNARNHGVHVISDQPNNGHRLLSAAITEYLSDIRLTKKPKTHSAYANGLEYFAESCHKLYLEDIERRDLLAFAAYLRDEKELAPQSCHNRFRYVVSFLKTYGIRGLAQKTDWPQFVEEEPEIYEREELDQLFTACSEEERLHYEFFLMTVKCPRLLYRSQCKFSVDVLVSAGMRSEHGMALESPAPVALY